MPTEAEYRYCCRLGMTAAKCARHLGISAAAVTKAKARLNLTFGEGMALSQGRQWEMEYFRYPWSEMAVGDWVEVPSYPAVVAYRANQRNPSRRFVSVTLEHGYAVRRAA
jgi:hypothetical protein